MKERTGLVLALTVLLLIAVVTAAVTANNWKHDFRVRRVTTEGNSIVPDSDIVRAAAIPGNGRLFDVDLNRARQRVQQIPFVRSAAVARELPDGITIEVTERQPVAALILDRVLYIDAEGFVLPPVRSGKVVDLPVVTGEIAAADCPPGERTRSQRLRGALEILGVARRIGDDLFHLISEVHCERDSGYILFTADGGIPVAFGRGDVAEKLVRLDGFWKQIVLQRGAAQLKTVDLRFADQVVVRWDGGRSVAAQ